MSDELKPCPFCGSDAFLHESDEFWYVSCNYCINQTTHFYNGKDIVIDRWNTRVDDPKLKLAVEALEHYANRFGNKVAAEALKQIGEQR